MSGKQLWATEASATKFLRDSATSTAFPSARPGSRHQRCSRLTSGGSIVGNAPKSKRTGTELSSQSAGKHLPGRAKKRTVLFMRWRWYAPLVTGGSASSGGCHRNPDQNPQKAPGHTLLRIEMGMLELDHEIMVGTHIRDMFSPESSCREILLPFGREVILPGAMPLRSWLPPSVASYLRVRPMPDFSCSTLGGNWLRASGTQPSQFGCSLYSLIVDQGNSHNDLTCQQTSHTGSRAEHLVDFVHKFWVRRGL